MRLSIGQLRETPEHRATVAGWIFEAFWRERPESSVATATLEAKLADAVDPDRIPLSLLALVDGRPAGAINLIENDDSKRPHLRPWLAALFVAPEFRGSGAGTSVVRELRHHAGRLDLPEL